MDFDHTISLTWPYIPNYDYFIREVTMGNYERTNDCTNLMVDSHTILGFMRGIKRAGSNMTPDLFASQTKSQY